MKNRIFKMFASACALVLIASCTAAPGSNDDSTTSTLSTTTSSVITTTEDPNPSTEPSAVIPSELQAVYDFSGITQSGTGLTTSDSIMSILTAATSTDIIDSVTGIAAVYAGNSQYGGYVGGGFIKLSTTSIGGKFTLHTKNNYLVNKAVVYTEYWDAAADVNASIAVGGAAAQVIGVIAGNGKTNNLTFEFNATHAVGFVFTARSFVFKIELYGGQSATDFEIPAVEFAVANKAELAEIQLAQSVNIQFNFLPTNTTDKTVTYNVVGTSVSVVGNTVTGLGYGTSTVTAKANNNNNLTDTFDVFVKGDATGQIAKYDLTVKEADEFVFKYKLYDANNPEVHTGESIKADLSKAASAETGLSDIISAVSIDETNNSVYYGNNSDYGPNPKSSGFIKLGATEKFGHLNFTLSEAVNKIIVKAQAWSASENAFKVNDVQYNLTSTAASYVVVTFDQPTTTFSIATFTAKNRIMIHALEFYSMA